MKNSCHGAGPMPGKPADSDTRAHSQGGALNYTARGNASQHIALVLEDAVRLGAMADPIGAVALFQRLPLPGHPMGRHSTGAMLVQSLAQSGDFETAMGLLEDLNCETGGAQAVVHFASDRAVQRRAIFAARERWRTYRTRADFITAAFAQHDFYHLYSQHWLKLELAEQESWLSEILLAIDSDPDHPTRSGFGGRVELHSMRDAHLFEVLNVLRTYNVPRAGGSDPACSSGCG